VAQRDISHSSVERIIAPDSTIALDYMLNRLKNLIANLEVFPDKMMNNLELTRGLIYSEALMLALIDKGLTRDDAYRAVQRNALEVWKNPSLNFKDKVKSDPLISKTLDEKTIDKCFDLKHHLRHVDLIFKRVFNSEI
jgi:adenylosuccinate lyase